MAESFASAERKILEEALARGEELRCPACGGPISERPVAPAPEVSYVRHRVWLMCRDCKRSGAVDVV